MKIKSKNIMMKAEELDELFDSGEDISEHLDLTSPKRIGTQPKKVNVDFPEWIAERLKEEQTHKAS